MTEHQDICHVDWPHNRAARRTLAKLLGYTQAAAERAFLAQNTDSDTTGLTTADFVGNRPPPVSVTVKDAGPRRLDVQAAPDVQVLINGKPAEFTTQWAASVEDLEHEYTLKEALRTQTDALEKCKVALAREWAKVEAARKHIDGLERHLAHLVRGRADWRTGLVLWVGIDLIDTLAQGRWFLATLCVLMIGLIALAHWLEHREDKDVPAPGAWLIAEPTKAQTICTDDICNCAKAPCDQPDVCGCDGFVADDAHMAGCGHAPSAPFNIPGVLPETPQVVAPPTEKELADGDKCLDPECPGHYQWAKDGDCSCFISAPCSACCPGMLECCVCGDNDKETK